MRGIRGKRSEYRQAVVEAHQRVQRLTEALRGECERWRMRPIVAALSALRGVDFLAAVTLVAEIGDFSRFAHPSELMGFLGLVPSEHSTGDSRRRGRHDFRMAANRVCQLAAPALFEQYAGAGAAFGGPIEVAGELVAFGCCNHIGDDHEAEIAKLLPSCFSGNGLTHFPRRRQAMHWIKTAPLSHKWCFFCPTCRLHRWLDRSGGELHLWMQSSPGSEPEQQVDAEATDLAALDFGNPRLCDTESLGSFRLRHPRIREPTFKTVKQSRSDLELHRFLRFEKVEEHTSSRRRDVARPVVIANPLLTLHFAPPVFGIARNLRDARSKSR